MDKSKIQKVNKALIATVFASSGIAVVVPPPKAAAASSPFTDINQYSDNYNEILKLYSQGVMSGFADNTFRPDVSVTRGEAAKMLATALKLDTKISKILTIRMFQRAISIINTWRPCKMQALCLAIQTARLCQMKC